MFAIIKRNFQGSELPFCFVFVFVSFHRDEVLEALAAQRMRFEAARSKKHKAREASDLLLLSLYCHIPPSRGMEIRTLEIVREQELESPFSATRFRDRNILLLKSSGSVAIHIQLYKTRRFTGHEQIDLQVGWLPLGLGLSRN